MLQKLIYHKNFYIYSISGCDVFHKNYLPQKEIEAQALIYDEINYLLTFFLIHSHVQLCMHA